MRTLITVLLLFSLSSCSVKLLKYNEVHLGQFVTIDKADLSKYQTHNREPVNLDRSKYLLCKILVIKQTKKGLVFMDCKTIDADRSSIRLIIKE